MNPAHERARNAQRTKMAKMWAEGNPNPARPSADGHPHKWVLATITPGEDWVEGRCSTCDAVASFRALEPPQAIGARFNGW